VSDHVSTRAAEENPSEAPAPEPTKPGNNIFGTLSLGFAVLGVVASFMPFTSGWGGMAFLVAIILAIIGLTRRGLDKKVALAGLLLAFAGWLVAIAVSVVGFFVGIGEEIQDPDVLPQPEAPVTGELGAPVTNAQGITFTLNSVECGLGSTGDELFDETPAGEYCRVDFRVDNGGSEKVTLYSPDITASAGGSTFEADDDTGRYGDDYVTTDLNPGLGVDAYVFIDVPVGTVLESVRFDPVISTTLQPIEITLG